MTATVTDLDAKKATRRPRKTTPAAAPPVGDDAELLTVDPRTLKIGSNVRLDARLDVDFIESIRERGVLEPIIAYRDPDGHLVVLRGQRRTLAAVETKRPTVRVIVESNPDEIDRITDQTIENVHRTGITDREEAAAIEQLALLGVSADDIVARTRRPRARVDAALRVAGSQLARKASERYDFLSIDHAAALAEFESDPDAVKHLVVAAQNGGFEHTVRRLREDRAYAEGKAAFEQGLRDQGVTVLDKRPESNHSKIQQLEYLKNGKRNATEKNHANCPGHACFVAHTYVAGEGEQAGQRVQTFIAVWVCTDYSKHGHELRYPMMTSSGRPRAADLPDEERERNRVERRKVIAGNKLWRSATAVRREWLAQFAARKTAPKGAATFLAHAIVGADERITSALQDSHRGAYEIFGLEAPAAYTTPKVKLTTLLDNTVDARAEQVLLTVVLAAYEAGANEHSWQQSDAAKSVTARYLRFLADNGYEPAPIELKACGVDVDVLAVFEATKTAATAASTELDDEVDPPPAGDTEDDEHGEQAD